MKIELQNSFITDNTQEIVKNCYFLKCDFNAKFWEEAQNLGANLINLKEVKELLNINENIKIVGITGTNGKTTTAAAIYSTLLDLGKKVFLCGTRGAFANDNRIDKKSLTTPHPIKLLSYLQIATREKCEFFVMEVSSHSISQNRIEDLNFYLKIFTNLSQDHLDFHQNLASYYATKSSFFMDESLKLINKDDENIKFNYKNSYTYGIKNQATFKILAYSLKPNIDSILKFKDNEIILESPLIGEFNLYNILAAFCAVRLLTKNSDNEISKALSNFAGVKGRVEVVSEDPLIVVDFAHTPDGIEKVLNTLKNHKLIVVFGAGGDRDKTKRPLMAKICEKFAYKIIVTSDNPRSEDPKKIIDDILKGFEDPSRVLTEIDRKMAIKMAINLAKNQECVVILGKGDEEYQEINGVKYPFSDQIIVKEILENAN
ncbi:UDP-N-acetylmuramoyl-L-alanyl-D-glutamate--2,6-diaminopimelate ligase [Campylobacter sp. FMV-PI01]|uniref:UDP-N-acetylmuramoyl-L-alanyl-D-glutamate--2,6-diaminopimelate ligase n=1 Tax=Campylobacter portucalensis TaxID=2608384 RepID=A0A6L5WJH0_9BACT|nr:UDP-N-acetylmuramoyl-L-alanyl-D-glutamate--2,6-diaminopimelate ligase [Campylobacter portucalensis]MSN95881.1 UDP-N-acetylmuramoyl-L-alanyl-D-glutamate--2,6-diaminopimelate ligase [Campylobacter portucalensis]